MKLFLENYRFSPFKEEYFIIFNKWTFMFRGG